MENTSVFGEVKKPDFSMLQNLVFQGGSVKGLAYLGVIQAMEEAGLLKQIRRVAGTSAGSIIATLLALGLNSNELTSLLTEFDFKAVLSDGTNAIVNTRDKVLRTVEKQEQGYNTFFSKIPAKTVKGPILFRVYNEFGIYEGEYIRQWIEKIIAERVSKITHGHENGEHLTFAKLHTLTQQYPGEFRDLYVVGVNVNLGQETLFSHDNPLTQDVIIADAVQISMSIPFIFKPHYVHYCIEGKRLVDTRRDIYVDGGFYNNFPIRCFDKAKYICPNADNPEAFQFNSETLGFRLVSRAQKDYLEGIAESPTTALNSFWQFGQVLLKGVLAKQNSDHILSSEDRARTIYIDHLSINTLAFHLTTNQQQALIESGKRAWQARHQGQTEYELPVVEIETYADILPDKIQKHCIIL